MFVSAYLDAARVLGGEKGAACRAFALKTLDRMLAEAWSDARGFAHRIGGARLDGSLDDQVFAATALLDAYEATLDRRYFDAARRAADFAIAEYFDTEGGGFFDRACGRAAHGRARSAPQAAAGFAHARRKFLRGDSARSPVRIHRRRALSCSRREDARSVCRDRAAVWDSRAQVTVWPRLLHARQAVQVVITGSSDDPQAVRLEERPQFRLPVRQSRSASHAGTRSRGMRSRPRSPKQLPHLRADVAQALVCVGTSCRPPVDDPEKLRALIAGSGAP